MAVRQQFLDALNTRRDKLIEKTKELDEKVASIQTEGQPAKGAKTCLDKEADSLREQLEFIDQSIELYFTTHTFTNMEENGNKT